MFDSDTEYQALLRAVLTVPEDDTVRLALADWLDEHSAADRAEFVRVQCELARIRQPHKCQKRDELVDAYGRYVNHCQCRTCKLRRREYYSSRRFIVWDWCGGVDDGWAHLIRVTDWSRGFVSSLTCTCAAFMQHAAAIFAAQPVTAVTISDREPGRGDLPRVFWQRESVNYRLWPPQYTQRRSYAVPDVLFDELLGREEMHSRTKSYDIPDLARAALSAACVSWARELVGLPPLTPVSAPAAATG